MKLSVTMPKVSFAAKFAAALVIASVVPLGVAGYWVSVLELDAVKRLSRDLYLLVTRTVNENIRHEVNETNALLRQTGYTLNNVRLDEQSAINTIADAMAGMQHVRAVALYTLGGQLIDVIAPQGASQRYPQTLPQKLLAKALSQMQGVGMLVNQQPVCGVLRFPAQKAPYNASADVSSLPPVLATAMAYKGERFTGVLVSVIENKTLTALTASVAEQVFGQSRGSVYLADDSLRLVAHSNPAQMLHVLDTTTLAGVGAFKNIMRGDSSMFAMNLGVSVEYEQQSGVGANTENGEKNAASAEKMLGTYSIAPELGLAIVVEQPQAVAYLPVVEMQRALVWWGLAGLVLAGVSGFALSRQFSRPIQQLVSATNQMAQQNFTHRFAERRTDEFGSLFATYNTVATELERYQQLNINKIVTERTKFEAMARQSSDGALYVDAEGYVLLMNQVFAEWFSIDAHANETKHIDTVCTKPEFKPLVDAIEQSMNATDSAPIDVELRLNRAGQIRETVLRGSLVRVQTDNITVGTSCVLRDVSKEVEIDRLKTDLVRIVAHELRSPLTSIKGFSDIIQMGGATAEETNRFAGLISWQADRLNETITKFLDVSRMESGQNDMQRLPFRINEVVQAVLEVNMMLAASKQMKVTTKIPEAITPIVGDPDLIRQVVLNLFSNAVKYSEANKTVRVTVIEREEDVYVAFEDEGFGISEADQQKLFGKFFRATSDERVRGQVGTGLGLSFIKEIIENHGGEIGVKSALHQGSTFWFTLPKEHSRSALAIE